MKNSLEIIDSLLEKNNKLLLLLGELKESEQFYNCTYNVHTCNTPNRFFLRKTSNGEELKWGKPSQLRSYLNLRKIKKEDVYNYHLISNIEEIED